MDYFLHEMTLLELDLCYDHIAYSDRPVWDTARILSLYTVAPHCKKKFKIQDMFPLPWDEEQMSTDEDDIKAHIAAMKELAKNL